MIATTVDESGTRRAVTKLIEGERLVSCVCCEVGEECCVYPASCGRGPEEVDHYGTILAGDGTTFGDTTNGVILESGAWAVYRNGARSTKDCLGLALPDSSVRVSAVLATSYTINVTALNFVTDPPIENPLEPFVVSYGGVIPEDPFVAYYDDVAGQCGWSGPSFQLSDEGTSFLFNPNACRWEIVNGALNFLWAYREQDSPIGEYVSVSGDHIDWVVS